MKFYDEEQMADIRKELEKDVLRWSGVAAKQMMGCLCYFYGKKFFTFLVTKGIVLTKLSEEDRAKLIKTGGKPFEMAGRTAKTWIRMPLREARDVNTVLPFVKRSYESARLPAS